jgi:hypothetical protein
MVELCAVDERRVRVRLQVLADDQNRCRTASVLGEEPVGGWLVREVNEIVIVTAPLRGDIERRRWYGSNGHACLVLTARRRLLEPYPTYGPTEYRLLAREVSVQEANTYALDHNFPSIRVV